MSRSTPRFMLTLTAAALIGCGPTQSLDHGGAAGGGGSGGGDMSGVGGVGSGGAGGNGGSTGTGDCSDPHACYTVYAHSNDTLYKIDLMAKTLDVIGPFKAPKSDTMTDLAVAPDNTIYTVSKTTLYTADPNDGHVTVVGTIKTCGMDNVALSTTDDGKLWVGDGAGAFCEIDVSVSPPAVKTIGTFANSMALAGDLVGIGDGTLFGTAVDGGSASVNDNLLVTIDPSTGTIKSTLGDTKFPKLYGVAYAMGKVFGFTHDGTGRVITINPKTGAGTLFNTFNDPTTNKPISFSGAGVNSQVTAGPIT